jgi:hypothetical protein
MLLPAMSLLRSVAFASLLVLTGSALGCGGGQAAKTAHVTPGPMPEGEQWTGVYFHELYGYLHLEQEGSNIVGKWKRKAGDKCGTLSGTVNGIVFHYQWREKTVGLAGPAFESHGKGYFVYKLDKEGRPIIAGQFGLNDAEVGSDWTSMKQPRLEADFKQVTCEAEGVQPNAF